MNVAIIQLNDGELPSNINRVYIDSEGDVNGSFILHYKDGTIRHYWSCDQGSLEVSDDGEYDLLPHEQCKLFDMWFSMDIDPDHPDYYSKSFCQVFDYATGLPFREMIEGLIVNE